MFIDNVKVYLKAGDGGNGAVTFHRENGRIFYFQPGHETFPTYYDKNVQTIIRNAVRYVAPEYREYIDCPHVRKIDDPEGYVIIKK